MRARIKRGLPQRALESLRDRLQLTMPEAASVLGTPARTLARYPAPPSLGLFGERWLRTADAAVLSIPSVVIPHERNFILNPVHASFRKITVRTVEPFSFDPRMWKARITPRAAP